MSVAPDSSPILATRRQVTADSEPFEALAQETFRPAADTFCPSSRAGPPEANGPTAADPTGSWTYSETVARGHYERSSRGLHGKHDHVRARWEDEATRELLRPFLQDQIAACRIDGRGLRVLDLGCGAGQGYELLTQIRQPASLAEEQRHVVDPADLELYLGIDLSAAMVQQGRANYLGLNRVQFEQVDLRKGLDAVLDGSGFDVYFSSYGALSHLGATELESLLLQIASHARPGALLVLDLIGRFSLEWPWYWLASTESEKTRPYSMSYLFGEDERLGGQVETFPIRFWTGQEVRSLCSRVSIQTQVGLQVREILDRSIFTGRHVDTREYGCPLPPLRRRINRLYEHNLRTDLASLTIDYRVLDHGGYLNEVFGNLSHAWNVVLAFTRTRLGGAAVDLVASSGWREYPAPLQKALIRLDRLIDDAARVDLDDVRANIIEPQLGCELQRMLYGLQEGLGCGHGLVAVISIDR